MSEDHAYYQLKELIRDEMLEQSPDLAKIMAKYKALTAAKDAEITALQMQIRIEGAVNANEITALKADNERMKNALIEIACYQGDDHSGNLAQKALSPADGDGVEESNPCQPDTYEWHKWEEKERGKANEQ